MKSSLTITDRVSSMAYPTLPRLSHFGLTEQDTTTLKWKCQLLTLSGWCNSFVNVIDWTILLVSYYVPEPLVVAVMDQVPRSPLLPSSSVVAPLTLSKNWTVHCTCPIIFIASIRILARWCRQYRNNARRRVIPIVLPWLWTLWTLRHPNDDKEEEEEVIATAITQSRWSNNKWWCSIITASIIIAKRSSNISSISSINLRGETSIHP